MKKTSYLCSREKEMTCFTKYFSPTASRLSGNYDKVHSYRRFSSNLIPELQEGSRLLCREQRITE